MRPQHPTLNFKATSKRNCYYVHPLNFFRSVTFMKSNDYKSIQPIDLWIMIRVTNAFDLGVAMRFIN